MRRLAAAVVVVLSAAAVALAVACGAVTAPFGVLALDDASLPLDSAAADARAEAGSALPPRRPRTCSADAPTCYLGQCVSRTPTYCPSGEGLGMDGLCTACTTLPVCKDCPIGDVCLGLQDVCVCAPYPFPACPAQVPSIGDACPAIGETCDFAATCGVEPCQCGPDYLWSCGVECDAGGTGH